MTEAQKEEEQLIKQTFQFYERNKNGTPIETFELPMLLEGKSHHVSEKCRGDHSTLLQQGSCIKTKNI